MMKRISAMLLILAFLWTPCLGEEAVDTLIYAVFPYLPDAAYYRELIEKRWAEIELNIPLTRAEWDCYTDGAPEGIDVVMYDAVMMDALVGAGWIRPIDASSVREAEDLYPYTLAGLTLDGRLYGIPVFLCGYYLIYDRDCALLAGAEHITDLDGEEGILVISSEDEGDREQFRLEALADLAGDADAAADTEAEEILALIDRLAVTDHKKDHSRDVARAYDEGIGGGYISYTETMRFLDKRAARTDIRPISFGSGKDVPRVYLDAAAVTSGAEGKRYEKCLELINVMAEAGILADLSAHGGRPQYLLLPRRSPYAALAERFPLYARLEEIAANGDSRVIRGADPAAAGEGEPE